MSNPFESPETFDSSFPPGRQTIRLRRVGILSVGFFFGVAGTLMGLLVGLLTFLVTAAGLANANTPVPSMVVGVGFLVITPIVYGFSGFIAGLINAALYNVVAGFSGGIELEFSPD